jgi:hypothetical protein
MISTDEVSTERLTQKPWPPPAVVAGDRLPDEAHAVLLGEFAVLMRIDDHEARFVVGEMPLDQGQGAFADRAEADHDDGAGNFRVDLRGGAHQLSPGEQPNGGI